MTQSNSAGEESPYPILPRMPSGSRFKKQAGWVALNLLAGVVYFLLAQLGLALALSAQQVSVVWPAAGFSLAAFLLFGYRIWPGIAIAAFAANALSGPVIAAAAIAAGNTFSGFASAWWLRQIARFDPSLPRLRDSLSLLFFGAMLSPCISATIGMTSLALAGVHPWASYPSLWFLWWFGDGMGVVLLSPLLLTWSTRFNTRLEAKELVDYGVMVLFLILLGNLIFEPDTAVAEIFPARILVFPFVIWAALRLGPAGASLGIFATTVMAIISAVKPLSPFGEDSADNLISLQIYMCIVAIIGLVMAAANSERRRIEKELRDSREQMRYTLQAAQVGTWDWDIERGAVLWSEVMESVHALPENSQGARFEDFFRDVHPEDRALIRKAIGKAIETRDLYRVEYRLLLPSGRVRWLEGKGQAFYDSHGGPIRMRGICTDITERKELELELKGLTDNLERQVQERTAMAEQRAEQLQAMALALTQTENRERRRLAHTLHDGLQQLLVGAKFIANRIQRKSEETHEVIKASTQLEAVLDQCIHASRSLSHDLAPPALIDRGFFAGLQRLSQEMHEQYGLRIDLDGNDNASGLGEDLKLFLYQSIRELLFNIVKHANVDRAQVKLVRELNELRVEVNDEGAGFDTQEVARNGDSGLGLVSIRERLELLGGRMILKSAPGKGCRFSIFMPCGNARSGRSSQPKEDTEEELPSVLMS